jgi:hypothetical protein
VSTEQRLGDPSSLEALRALHDRQLNFDLSARDRMTREGGWRIDDYC